MVHHKHAIKGLENGLIVNVVYYDSAKTFEKVDHSMVLTKLRKIGVVGRLGSVRSSTQAVIFLHLPLSAVVFLRGL